ncbi:hypothetical protein LSAT2_028767 [Lamellibrachia satsuma]|nr:hypothetical protein LSAT2_028767 [Lamellibrachia satsuma]
MPEIGVQCETTGRSGRHGRMERRPAGLQAPYTTANAAGASPSALSSPSVSRSGSRRASPGPLGDSYTAAIELSNTCRRFYVARLHSAKRLKEKLVEGGERGGGDGGRNERRQQTPLDKSMNVLRKEMASLIDQDLNLMRQLLTLNERIEDLKWQQKLDVYHQREVATPTDCSGDELDGSDPGDEDRDTFLGKYPSPSALSLFDGCGSHDELDRERTNAAEQDTNTSDLGSSEHVTSSASSLERGKSPLNFASQTTKLLCVHGRAKALGISRHVEFASDEKLSFDSGIHES